MKNLLILLFIVITASCTCLGQLQTQYLFVDENCQAQVPDYISIVNAEDNCEGEITLTQYPPVNSYITIHMEANVTATDISGNTNVSTFTIMLLDTIPPALYFTDTIAYNPSQIKDIYLTFVGWVVNDIQRFEDNFNWEEFNLDPNDPNMKCYRNIICPDYFDWLVSN